MYIQQYGRSSGRKDLLTKILSAKAEAGEAQLSDKETSNEIGNLIFAGTGERLSCSDVYIDKTDQKPDTTSTTLTFLFWELSRHQEVQDQLRRELDANIDSVPTILQVTDLPVLDAVINEALRLHPAAPASLPRETPRGGREINGYFMPETVSCDGCLDCLERLLTATRRLYPCNATPPTETLWFIRTQSSSYQKDGLGQTRCHRK